jgi:hypothetical protein
MKVHVEVNILTKNKLEKLISGSMEAWRAKQWFIMKLHNNPLAHQTTPADYLLTIPYKGTTMFIRNIVLLEAKLVTCDEGKGRFALKRLKQLHDLLQFFLMDVHNHSAYIALAYYDERWANSELYIIPIQEMNSTILSRTKESINREEAKEEFAAFRVTVAQGGVIQWDP